MTNIVDYFVHESSYIDAGARIGSGTKIWHFCHIMASVQIGQGCNIGQNVYVGDDVQVGDHVKIQNNVSIYRGVLIEDDVFIGPSAVFTNVINPRSHVDRKNEFQTTWVKRGSSIGANATIVCGVVLGEYCLIGAGSVVTRDVPSYALVYGNPARLRGWVCGCGQHLKFTADSGRESSTCESCGQHHLKQGDLVTPVLLTDQT